MDHGVFYLCTALTSVTCKATTPPSGGKNYFQDVDLSACKLYVPEGSVEAYKADEQWSGFGDNILPIPDPHTAIDPEVSPLIGETGFRWKGGKVLKDGHLYIHHNGQTFTASGTRVE